MNATTRKEIEREIVQDLTLTGCEYWRSDGDEFSLQSVCEHGNIVVVVDANYEYLEEDEEDPTGEVFTNRFYRFVDFTIHEATDAGRDISDEFDWGSIENNLYAKAKVRLVS